MTDLSKPIYSNNDAARKHLEGIRWANGTFCPHCGEAENVHRLGGKAGEQGMWHCRSCRRKFSVTVGTVFERSHIPLPKWLLAVDLMAASKKGVSAHQLHRMLGITYKSAWFMAHRIREAMKEGAWPGPLGGSGKVVEADETYIGRKKGMEVRRSAAHKLAVMSLVERGGKVRSFKVDGGVTSGSVRKVLSEQVDKASVLMTDDAGYYKKAGKQFADHQSVNHSAEEYVRGLAHTNTIEGFFSIFKRGMKGIYQHCGEQHLKRYLTEFDFRYNHRAALKITDEMRAVALLKGIEGRRLTYRRTH